MRGLSWCNKYNIIKNVRDHQGKKNQRGIEFCDDNHAGEARGGGGTAAVSSASCDRAGAEVSGGHGDDGGRVGGGNDLGGRASRRSSQRSSTREEDCRIGCDWGAVSDGGD